MPAGRRSANSVDCRASRTTPTRNSRSSGPWTSEANISRRPPVVRPTLAGLRLRAEHDDVDEVQPVEVGRRLDLEQRALRRRALDDVPDDADRDVRRRQEVGAAGGEHEVADDDPPEHRRVVEQVDLRQARRALRR